LDVMKPIHTHSSNRKWKALECNPNMAQHENFYDTYAMEITTSINDTHMHLSVPQVIAIMLGETN